VEGEDGSITLVAAGGAIEGKKVVPSLGRPFKLTVGQTLKIEPEGP